MNFLKRLFSKPAREPADVPPEFLQETPPDWLLDLKGKESPEGSNFSIRVQLFTAQRTGTAEILILPRDESEQPKTATTELARPELDKLFVILGFSFPDEMESVPVDDSEGPSVTLSVHRREPLQMRSADCNLAGWLDSKKTGAPVIEISRILIAARNRALPK
jgi:hypothetical protein